MEPFAGLIDQVTVGTTAPVTSGENCCVWQPVRLTLVGLIVTLVGMSVTVAVSQAATVGLQVAQTVTASVTWLVMEAVAL